LTRFFSLYLRPVHSPGDRGAASGGQETAAAQQEGHGTNMPAFSLFTFLFAYFLWRHRAVFFFLFFTILSSLLQIHPQERTFRRDALKSFIAKVGIAKDGEGGGFFGWMFGGKSNRESSSGMWRLYVTFFWCVFLACCSVFPVGLPFALC